MTEDNVVSFSGHKHAVEQQRFDTLVEDELKLDDHIHSMVDDMLVHLVDHLDEMGFDVTQTTDADKDLVMIGESIKGLIYRSRGVRHPMQAISEYLYNTVR